MRRSATWFGFLKVFLLLVGLLSLGIIEVKAGENIWTWVGLSYIAEKSLVADPANPNLIYAISNSQLMRSMDGGVTWMDVAGDWEGCGCIEVVPGQPQIVFACTELGLFKSENYGDTWQKIHDSTPIYAVAISPVDSQEIIIGSHALEKSSDGGQTWRAVTEELPGGFYYYWNIEYAPSAPHILMASPINVAVLPSIKSTDGGETWTEISSAPYHVNSITFDPQSSNIVYISTISLSWKTVDGGNTWFPLANGLGEFVYDFVVDPTNTQVIHAANGNAGVLESLDGGMTWTPINAGIPGLNVESIAISSRDPLQLFAGIPGGGVWEMTRTTVQDYSISINDGDLFTNQTSVTLNLTAPPGTSEMIISNDGGFSGKDWEPYAAQRDWIISAYGENVLPRTVYVKFKTYGQISGLYQDDIILDTVAPQGGVEIDVGSRSFPGVFDDQRFDGALYLPIIFRDYRPGYRLVNLTLTATDDLSGVSEMLLGDDALFTASDWVPYEEEFAFWAVDKASITIFAKFRDRAGNESDVYSDSFTP